MLNYRKRSFRFILYAASFVLILELLFYFYLNVKDESIYRKAPEIAKVLISSCENASDWQKCYGNNLGKIIEKRGIKFTLKVKEEIEKIDKKTLKCHLIAHYIALANVESDPNAAYDLFKYVGTTSCAYGFVHGTVEGLNRHDPKFVVSEKSIPEICRKIGEANAIPQIDQGCIHSMGHLLLSDICSESIEEGIEQAKATCSKLSQDLRNHCYGGIFMESFIRDNLNVHCNTPDVKLDVEFAEQQEKICLSQKGEEAKACWQEISHIYVNLYPFNPEETFLRCKRAPKEEDAANCYIHIVSVYAWRDNLTGKYTLPTICGMFKEDPQLLSCYSSAVRGMLYTSLEHAPQANEICSSLDRNHQDNCFDILIETAALQTKFSENKDICSKLSASYQSRCQSAVN